MNFDWTTFALEVLNFLVLVWLLKRFFYRPVLEIIERRRAQERKAVAESRALHDQAQALKASYEERIAHAAEDRQRALARLDDEIAAARSQRLAALETEIDAERGRRLALQERERAQQDAERERQALALGLRFTSRLLERLAGPALEDQLVALTLDELAKMPQAQRDALRTALADAGAAVEVASAFPLPPPQRTQLSAAIEAVAGRPRATSFVEDPALKAGMRIRAGAWVLMANLADELAYFGAGLDHAA